jgi:hypothetical protein
LPARTETINSGGRSPNIAVCKGCGLWQSRNLTGHGLQTSKNAMIKTITENVTHCNFNFTLFSFANRFIIKFKINDGAATSFIEAIPNK